MKLNFRQPCPDCIATLEAGIQLHQVDTIQGPIATFCAHNLVGAVVWVDRGIAIGWETFSCGSLEQAQNRVDFQLEGASRVALAIEAEQKTQQSH
jgi:hypothetical protein